MLWWSQAFLLFNFLLKSENTQFDRFANISYYYFLMKFHTFLTTHNFEKSLCSRNFLNTIFQTVPLFFQRRPFFRRNCVNAILLCTTLSSALSILSLFPLFFPFHLSCNQTGYYFPNSANKKKWFEDINKKNLNLVRMKCKIHILHHPIRDVASAFYLKLSTLYRN